MFVFTTTTRWKSEKSQKENTRRKHTQKTRRQQHARLAVVPRGNNQLSRSGRRHCRWPSESLPQPMVFLLFPPYSHHSLLCPALLAVAFCEVIKCQNRLAGAMVNEVDLAARHSPAPRRVSSVPRLQLTNLPKLSGTRGVYVLFSTLYI